MRPAVRHGFSAGFVLAGCLVASISAEDFSGRGPALVGYQTVVFARPNATQGDAVIYYPAVKAGFQQSLDRGQAPCPVVVFISPIVPIPAYAQTLAHLASWGFIVMAPMDGFELYPDQVAIADDMRLCLDFIATENRRSQSTFHNAVDTERAAFCGHSWGGACTILAGVKEPTRVKVVVNFACWSKSSPSPLEYVGNLTCPLVMLTGDEDSMTPLSRVRSVYDAAVPAKTLIVVRDGIHFGFLDDWYFLPSIKVRQVDIARHYTTASLLLHLRKRTELKPILWDPEAANFGDVVRQINIGNASQTLLIP